jgi:hypothetical protein
MGWFAIFIGASVLAASAHGAIFLEAPPASNSLTRGALVQGLVGLLGTEGGYLVYHLIYALGGALALWAGVKILQMRAS